MSTDHPQENRRSLQPVAFVSPVCATTSGRLPSGASAGCALRAGAFRGLPVAIALRRRRAIASPSDAGGRSGGARRGSNSSSSRSGTTMLVDPWSVSAATLDVVAAQLFAVSLFPYLAFLYWLSRDNVDCPPLAEFGFRFLLVFVGATIPAGIYAKTHYHDILANVDWLHGSAESLLTVTNLLITLGFRDALSSSSDPDSDSDSDSSSGSGSGSGSNSPSSSVQSVLWPLGLAAGATGAVAAAGGLAAVAGAAGLAVHAEPGNALSLGTWVIHVSSLIEWLIAMRLVWEYGERSGEARWRGLVWGMVPLHASGLCACTFHVFYNAAGLNALVALQAGLTALGNATMAAATWRLARGSAQENDGEGGVQKQGEKQKGRSSSGSSSSSKRREDAVFVGKMIGWSLVASVAIKWGSLLVDLPFEGSRGAALAMIFGPTALNVGLWAARSRGAGDDFGPSWL